MFNALSPHDYKVVFAVFRDITKSEWFDRNPANEKACAKFVINQYGAGGISEAELRARCVEVAQEQFGRRH